MNTLSKTFNEIFGHAATATEHASGRVNLIGEHTDYNGGFVLPTAIPQQTIVEMSKAPAGDRKARVSSANQGFKVHEYEIGKEAKQTSKEDHWLDYIQGVTCILVKEGFELGGFHARIHSQVPMGSGLSSSAALEVSFMRALRTTFGLKLDDVRLAQLCQKVENDFVGARVGIMDPMACSLADVGTALFLDTQSMEYKQVKVPEAAELIVINSGVAHRNVGGGYNTRRAECESACEALGITLLREVGMSDLPRVAKLPDVLSRRAKHVITENERVLQSVAAMNAQDPVRLGELFKESHLSMKQDYEVSIPEIDLLVELASSQKEVYGARLTGGGFGGSIVILVRKGTAVEVSQRIAALYAKASGEKPTVIVPGGT
ncbi:MAG: galactokinase [Methylotenera sp.]|nr:galactokinase [Oligoflexia bacterium]